MSLVVVYIYFLSHETSIKMCCMVNNIIDRIQQKLEKKVFRLWINPFVIFFSVMCLIWMTRKITEIYNLHWHFVGVTLQFKHYEELLIGSPSFSASELWAYSEWFFTSLWPQSAWKSFEGPAFKGSVWVVLASTSWCVCCSTCSNFILLYFLPSNTKAYLTHNVHAYSSTTHYKK